MKQLVQMAVVLVAFLHLFHVCFAGQLPVWYHTPDPECKASLDFFCSAVTDRSYSNVLPHRLRVRHTLVDGKNT